MKRFKCTIYGLLFIILLPNMGLCDAAWYYVNGTNGDDNNTCTLPDNPCKTIKAALEKVSHGSALIKITQGTYEEQGMYIPAHQYITLEGGWNNSFTGHICKAEGTTIVAADYQGFGTAFFSIYFPNNGDDGSMALQCLTLQPAATGGYPKAISITTNNGATAQLTMAQARVTGFTGDPVVALTAQTVATTTATLTRTTFDQNHAYGAIISLSSGTGSTAELNINKVWLKNNTGIPHNYSSLVAESHDSGATRTSITNSVLAANSGGISLLSTGQSSNSITVSNCTFTDNPRFEMELIARNSSTLSATLTDSILQDNDSRWRDIFLKEEDTAGIAFHADYSILGDHEIEKIGTGTTTYRSNNEVHGDPRLSSTYHLRKGSAAIDAGICGEWINTGGIFLYNRIAPLDDIDGDKRPGFGQILGCDIGADEYRPFSWPMFLPAIVHQWTTP